MRRVGQAAKTGDDKGQHLMRLQRRASMSHVKHEETSSDWNSSDGVEAHVDFTRFGEGTERTAYFRVVLTWADIEAVLSALAEKKHDGAMQITKALRLAEAVADLSVNSN